jgi:nicotinate dehydrogenase subunit B
VPEYIAGADPRFRLCHLDDERLTDLPELDVVLLDRSDLPSAGAGEIPLIAVAPAIANAIFAATGRRLRSLPLLPAGMV